MKKRVAIILITLLGVGVSCQKQPKASFTVSKSECYVGETVSLTSSSTDASSYKWTIDNVSSGASSSLNFTPTSAGTKIIKLEGISKNGKKTDDDTKTLLVKNINEAFKGTYKGNANSGCEFENLAITTNGTNQISCDIDGTVITAVVNSLTNATIISYSETDTDGSVLTIKGGSITLIGNTITTILNFSYYDATDSSTSSSSCTSVFVK